MRPLALLLLTALLAGCREEPAEAPPPVEMTQDALSYYCQMNIADHGGPKGQIHLDGLPQPLFFAQVRDLVAFLKSPERDAPVIAVYVSDMGAAPSWSEPGADNWIDAHQAHFVTGAGVAGGMGAPEIVPFASRADAEAFAIRYGGEILPLDAIPDEAAIGPVDLDAVLEEPS
ncbi:MAG: nitrous oxide reductase accessory protein NosL [Tropicimonas sp.]|uniref:nitrous oxide reductase accessory protein NosL n=1 Tax=Tropicimonas sp. TaxID=2067044 RepID=UPI003A857680